MQDFKQPPLPQEKNSIQDCESNKTQSLQATLTLDSFIHDILQEILRRECRLDSNPLHALITQTRQAIAQTNALSAQQKHILKSLQQNLDKPMKVAVIGQFSSGKSTFLNALLGSEILPSGITPVTAKVCEISYDKEVSLEIIYKNGKEVSKEVDFLNKVDELENAKIAYYKLYVPLPLLKTITFLDTPGFNSQRQSDTHITNRILESVEGIIWLSLIDNVGKNSEKDVLQKHIKAYATKSLCVLNQKDRLKSESEVEISLKYAKGAFHGYFEEIVAISAKEALDSINAQDPVESKRLYTSSNIESVINFIQNSIKPQAEIAKEHRLHRVLRSMLVRQKRKIHKINMCQKDLIRILRKYNEKVRFSFLQSDFEGRFKKCYIALESNLSAFAQRIYNAFELKDIEVVRESKNMLGLTKQSVQVKKANFLPKERLLNELSSDEYEGFRELKKIGFEMYQIGQDFGEFSAQQTRELRWEVQEALESWMGYIRDSSSGDSSILDFEDSLESSLLESGAGGQLNPSVSLDSSASLESSDGFYGGLEGSGFTDSSLANGFNMEFLESRFLNDIFKIQDSCINTLQNELHYLQKILSEDYKNAIFLCLERLNYEVFNALQKHKEQPDTLPLYNPTLENTRVLLNQGLHFGLFEEKLNLNFSLYKKTIWNLTSQLGQICEEKIEEIFKILESNSAKIRSLKSSS